MSCLYSGGKISKPIELITLLKLILFWCLFK